jgi:NTE family protein
MCPQPSPVRLGRRDFAWRRHAGPAGKCGHAGRGSAVRIGDRLLVDGGLSANLPVSQAVELGASGVVFVPAVPEVVDRASRGAIDVLQRSIVVAPAALTPVDLAPAVASVDVNVLPVSTTKQLSIFDFDETPTLIHAAYLASSAWRVASECEWAQ